MSQTTQAKSSLALANIISTLRQALPDLVESYHVETLAVFGSYVHNEQKADSDLDVLVSFSQTPGLFAFIELEYYLADLLGIEVDLVMRDSLKEGIAPYILAEEVPVQ